MKNVQFGCGRNRLSGWYNHDSDVDISKKLPFASGMIDNIFLEHSLEHLSPNEALSFLDEAYRILVVGGAIRVVVPSVSRIFDMATDEYCSYVAKRGWGDGSRISSVRAIMTQHGHQSWWTAELLEIALSVAGFVPKRHEVGCSNKQVFVGIEGHHKVVGEAIASLESVVYEGAKE